jgi:hypothetical protein
MKAIINRRYEKNQTPGIMIILDKGVEVFACHTLELKWMGNIKSMSCIPEGTYKVEKIIRPSGKPGLWVKDVPERSAILIHSGNYASGLQVDIEGCILVGSGYKDLNNDGNLDIIDSTATFEDLFEVVDNVFDLEIFS